MKKEFHNVTWYPEPASLVSRNVNTEQEEFFNRRTPGEFGNVILRGAVLPSGISYSDLGQFVGKKTKVTIEVQEW